MRLRQFHIALLFPLLLAGCDRSGGGSTAGGSSTDAVLTDAQATLAAIREQTGDVAAPSGPPAETTGSGGPKRRDGLWEMGLEGDKSDPQQMCVGAGSEESWSLYDELVWTMERCTRKSLTRQGAGWRLDLDCDVAESKFKMLARISGDFRDNFRVEQSGTVDGAPRSQTILGVHRGSCPANFKPGDAGFGGAVMFNQLKK